MRLRANGYQVIAAHNGAQTVELAHQEKPDLIILDIKMPDKDSYIIFEDSDDRKTYCPFVLPFRNAFKKL